MESFLRGYRLSWIVALLKLGLLLLLTRVFFRPYPKDAIVSNLLNCPSPLRRVPSRNFFFFFLCSLSIQAL